MVSYFTSSPSSAPSFDETTVMSSQRDTLPPYLLGLDVSSVEGYVNGCRGLTGEFVRRGKRRERLRRQSEAVEWATGEGGNRTGNGEPETVGRVESVGSSGSTFGLGTPEPVVKSYGDISSALAMVPPPFFTAEFNLKDKEVFERFLMKGGGIGGGRT